MRRTPVKSPSKAPAGLEHPLDNSAARRRLIHGIDRDRSPRVAVEAEGEEPAPVETPALLPGTDRVTRQGGDLRRIEAALDSVVQTLNRDRRERHRDRTRLRALEEALGGINLELRAPAEVRAPGLVPTVHLPSHHLPSPVLHEEEEAASDSEVASDALSSVSSTATPAQREKERIKQQPWYNYNVDGVLTWLKKQYELPNSKKTQRDRAELEILTVAWKYNQHYTQEDSLLIKKRIRLIYVANARNWQAAYIDQEDLERDTHDIQLSDRAAAARPRRQYGTTGPTSARGRGTSRRPKRGRRGDSSRQRATRE